MYIAYYQRPADPAGLVYWLDEFNKAGGGTAGWNAIAGAFANAPESQALFGTATLGQKISAIYLAALNGLLLLRRLLTGKPLDLMRLKSVLRLYRAHKMMIC